MGMFDNFPYTNFHELNLDWILKMLKEIDTTMDQFVAINTLKYADPIQWDITTQYEKNTIVIDPQTGTAYISVQAVPSGVSITNTDYWSVVFDLGAFVVRASKNFAAIYEESTTLTATVSVPKDSWIVWGDTLYKALVNITAGDQYVVNSNILHFTMEDLAGHLEDLDTTDKSNLVAAINEVLTTLTSTAGVLSNLSTTDKTNLVAAINEVLTTLTNTAGDLANLNTTDKTNLVAAINEVLTTLTSITGTLSNLSTTDKTNLVAAINEVLTTLISTTGTLSNLSTTDKTNLVAAINEVLTTLTSTTGTLSNLSTTDKTNLVAAINEVLTTLTSITGTLSNLNTTDKTNLVAAINEVAADNPIKGKIIAFYGDSYGSDNPHKIWLTKLAQYTGATVYNHSTSGGTAANVLTNVQNNAHSDADICIFECGINDWLNQVSLAVENANIYNILDTLKTNSPNAQIYGITMPAGIQDNNGNEHALQIPREIYRQIMTQLCLNHGAGVISSAKFLNVEYTNYQHLTEAYFTNYYWKEVVKSLEHYGDGNVFLDDYAVATYPLQIHDGFAELLLSDVTLSSTSTRLVNTLDVTPLATTYIAVRGYESNTEVAATVEAVNSDAKVLNYASCRVWGRLPITYVNRNLIDRF